MKFTAACALVGAASAQQKNMMDLPVFTGESFANHNIVQSMLDATSTLIATDGASGVVSYSQCDDDIGSFTLDTDSTTNTPNPIPKGCDLSFHLEGILSDKIHMDNMHIHVDWNGTPLYDEDHAVGADFEDVFTQDLGWKVPGFAPNGEYVVTIKGTDSS